jgi:hypothetical protein
MSWIESETVKWKATRQTSCHQTSRIGDANNGSAECHVSKGIPPLNIKKLSKYPRRALSLFMSEPPFAHARLESVAELIKEGQSRCLVLQAVGDSPWGDLCMINFMIQVRPRPSLAPQDSHDFNEVILRRSSRRRLQPYYSNSNLVKGLDSRGTFP